MIDSLKKEKAHNEAGFEHKYSLGSGMEQEYVRNCMTGWVEEYKRLDGWIGLTENVLIKPKHLSKFGIDLYQLMLERAKAEQAKCRRKIRWLGQLHDKATKQHRFTPKQFSMDKEAIRQRIDLVEFIGGYTQLRPYGASYKGLCPLHQEKTPSLYVRPDKGWYCHGCNKGGDVYKFVMEAEGVDFATALKQVGGQL